MHRTLFLAGKSSNLTSFFSIAYLAFFLPLCLFTYSIIPNKWKKYCLLLMSYAFFWLISGKLLVYLILTTFSMHYFGLWLDRIQGQKDTKIRQVEKEERNAIKILYQTRQRWVLLLAVVLHIGILFVLKYSLFFTGNVNTLFTQLHMSAHIHIPKYIMPIGISFFTMQALSYILDVYHGVTKADENIGRLALFISFFPQIVEGPICRYHQTADQLWNVEKIKYSNLTLGLQRILFGMMKKIVIADRLNPFVQNVFDHYQKYEGGIIAIAAVCYTIQLYMDFSGSMDAVMGTAQIFGVVMPENFKRPFFSKTISEFWQRWHITLGTWLKDYIFYPITTAKKIKNMTSVARKRFGNHYGPLLAGSIAVFAVWFCNGLWHGAAWHYIFFGMYHFMLIISGIMINPIVKSINKKLHIKTEWFGYRYLQIVRTTIFVIIGELFFRANGLRAGLEMFQIMVSQFSFHSLNNALLLKMGIDLFDIMIVCITLFIVFVISILNEKGIAVRDSIATKNVVFRWTIWYVLILFIVIFGAYGFGYAPVDPIYAEF